MNIKQKIPNGWSIKKLGEVSRIITGLTPPTFDISNYGNEFLFVSPADITDNLRYITNTITKLSRKGINFCRIVEKGSPLFVCIGSTIGKIAIAGERLATNQQINSCVVYKDFNNVFLYYQLLASASKIKLLACEQAVPIINKTTFEKIELIFPPLPEQEKIVSILSKQDEVIEKLEELIQLKTSYKKGLMQRLLSGKVRLKGFSGEWREAKIGDVIHIYAKTGHKSCDGKDKGKYPFFINNSETFCKFLDTFDHDAECIIANTGGNAFFDYYNGKFAATSDCLVFSSNINTPFLYNKLKLIEKKINIVGFSGSGIKHLDKKYFYSSKIMLPPTLEEQSAIASILLKCDEEIELLREQLENYKKQKKWLMEKLLSGEIRVNEPNQ